MNKIDWKYFSQTTGYKSLKAAYIEDIKRSWRNKKEGRKKFQWVIDRAKHHAYHKGVSIWTILNFWESKRDYWWLNYYQNMNQPKLIKNKILKPIGVKGIRKHYKNTSWPRTKQEIKHEVCKYIQNEQQQNSTKKKPRWTSVRKKRGY